FALVGDGLDQTNLFQVGWRDGFRDCVADRLMETVIGATAKQWWLHAIRKVIVIMAKFMMDDREIFARGFNAHLHPDVLLRINVPCARVAHYVAVTRFRK